MAHHEDPLTRLSAELDDLRATVNQLRDAVTAQQEETSGPSAPADQAGGWTSPAALLAQALNAKVTALRASMRAVQTQISTLEARLERAEREAWQQKAKRAEATARLNNRERLLRQIEQSAVWKSVKPLWKLMTRGERHEAALPTASGDLAFGIEAPAEWKTSSEILVIKGWCLSRSGRAIAGVRAKIGKTGRLGRYGLERRDIATSYARTAGALQSGFSIDVPLSAGVSHVQLEAIVQGGEWEPFFEHSVEREGTAADHGSGGTSDRAAGVGRPTAKPLPRLPAITTRKAAELLVPLLRKHQERLEGTQPLFSVITPAYNSKPQWIAEAALTLLHQSLENWEWCIVDDGSDSWDTHRLLEQLAASSERLRVKFIDNSGISVASNQALDLATGDFVCFLDHDDLLDSNALWEMQKKLRRGFDAVYSDEDKLDDLTGRRVEEFFKPDWSPEYLRGVMYVGHLLCVRRELAQRVRLDSAFDGVQDFEFMLRLSETGAKIGHVAKVLYHWRKTPGSIADSVHAKPEAAALQRRAVNAHLKRLGLSAGAESKAPHRLRIVPRPRAVYPRVSIIIPTKDAPQLLERCLASLHEKTSYPDFEVLLVDNGTTDAEALRTMKRYPVRRIDFPERFNFSRANNRGATEATGSFLVFLNNDTEITTPDWLQHLLWYAEQPDVGAAGTLLLYGDGTVQHAGVVLGMRGTADHVMRGFPSDLDGYAGSLSCAREVSAVTAACMMMRKELFQEIGGFNEHFFTAYQDADLCLRLRERGLRIIYTPEAVVIHHESRSRKNYYDMVDRMLLLDRWEPVIERGDPYYNPNLALERGDYSPARP